MPTLEFEHTLLQNVSASGIPAPSELGQTQLVRSKRYEIRTSTDSSVSIRFIEEMEYEPLNIRLEWLVMLGCDGNFTNDEALIKSLQEDEERLFYPVQAQSATLIAILTGHMFGVPVVVNPRTGTSEYVLGPKEEAPKKRRRRKLPSTDQEEK